MNITVIPYTDPTVTLEDFANKFGLELFVHERGPDFPDFQRWYAYFEDVQIINNHLEKSDFGSGSSQYYAILDYIERIQGQKLKHNGMLFEAPKFLSIGKIKTS